MPVWAGICVAVTVFLLVWAAASPLLAVIPASVYGFAVAAAYGLLATKLDTLTAVSMHNPLTVSIASLVIGGLIGYLSEKLAGVLAAAPQVPQKA